MVRYGDKELSLKDFLFPDDFCLHYGFACRLFRMSYVFTYFHMMLGGHTVGENCWDCLAEKSKFISLVGFGLVGNLETVNTVLSELFLGE